MLLYRERFALDNHAFGDCRAFRQLNCKSRSLFLNTPAKQQITTPQDRSPAIHSAADATDVVRFIPNLHAAEAGNSNAIGFRNTYGTIEYFVLQTLWREHKR